MANDDYKLELTTRCWICGKPMKRFAQDSWYWYYRCEDCDTERLEPKERDNADMPEM